MNQLERKLNKWQIAFSFGGSAEYLGYKKLRLFFAIIKLKYVPFTGVFLMRGDYDGFIIDFKFKNPISLLVEYLEHKGF